VSAAVALRRAEPERRLSLFSDTPGRERTLAELLAGIWQGLAAAGRATCPLCGSGMDAHDGGGRCTGCGSTLS